MGRDGEAAPLHGGLAWESLGSGSPTRAFLSAAGEMLTHPARFFGKVAQQGGLHEPTTFFAIAVATLLVAGFPAALCYFWLTAPDPATVAPEVYQMHSLPARATGIMLALLPVVVLAAPVAVVLAASLWHVGARAFGARGWEASATVIVYCSAAALIPALVCTGCVLVVSGLGLALQAMWPGAAGPVTAAARAMVTIVLPLGAVGGGVVVFAVAAVMGCTQTLGLDSVRGAAAALAGAALVGVLVAICTMTWRRGGVLPGSISAVVLLLLAVTVAVRGARGQSTQGET